MTSKIRKKDDNGGREKDAQTSLNPKVSGKTEEETISKGDKDLPSERC